MFVLYEGSVRTDIDGAGVIDVLRAMESGRVAGQVDVFAAPEEWESWVRNCYMEDGEIDELFRETGMPERISDGQVVVAFEGHGGERHVLFDGEPGADVVNAAMTECFPDYGYRIVEE